MRRAPLNTTDNDFEIDKELDSEISRFRKFNITFFTFRISREFEIDKKLARF